MGDHQEIHLEKERPSLLVTLHHKLEVAVVVVVVASVVEEEMHKIQL